MSRRSPVVPSAPKRETAAKPAAGRPAEPGDDPAARKSVSGWVKAFVFLHVLAVSIWAFPNPPAAYDSGQLAWKLRTGAPSQFAQSLNDGLRLFVNNQLKPGPLKYYVLATGFWQYWDMFAPNPANVDFYGDADVEFKNGEHETYTYPRMYKLGIFQKYAMERFRKYYERAHDDSYQYVWGAFAQRIAFLATDDPRNPAVIVKLYRHWRPVPDVGKTSAAGYSSFNYFNYAVDVDKLESDLKDAGRG